MANSIPSDWRMCAPCSHGVGAPLQTRGADGWILIIMRELSALAAALTAFQCRQCPVAPIGLRGSSRTLLLKISG